MRRFYLVFVFVFLIFLVNPSFAATVSGDNFAVCLNGIFEGTENENIIAWKGIPFAKAPIGNLRWKAPQAPDNSSETFSAKEFAYIPLQEASVSNPDSYERTSEDCLYLNVWKSTSVNSNSRPVVVWIYGGGYDSGATSNSYYDGGVFVGSNPDIIFVSIAYRVGMMGFIDFSQVSGGEDYKDSTNLGLLDILQGLRWVNDNISAFGGDKENITVMGQSAGAGAISLLMTIPESKNLFKRAILESGSVALSTRKDDALKLTEKLLEVTNKTDMAGLTSLSVEELNSAMPSLASYLNFPILDGRILSEDIYEAFANNSGNFDILSGSNADELRFWEFSFGKEIFDELVRDSFVLVQNAIENYSSEDLALTEDFIYLVSGDYAEFFNDLLFRGPAIAQSEANSEKNNSGKTFMYYWEYPINFGFFEGFGACHCAEIGYFLNNFGHPVVPMPDLGLLSKINPLIANFIRTGNPSTSSTTWNEYDSNTRQTLIIKENGDLTIESAPLDYQREIITPLLKWGVSGREMIRKNIENGISINPNALKDKEEENNNDDEQLEPEPQQPDLPDSPDSQDLPVEPNPQPTPDSDEENSNSVVTRSSSGGSCNFGFSALNMLALSALIFRKKK